MYPGVFDRSEWCRQAYFQSEAVCSEAGVNVLALFGVGDIVTVRQWDDLVAEYGKPNSIGAIAAVPFHFTTIMRDMLSGNQYKVVKIDENVPCFVEDNIRGVIQRKTTRYWLDGVYFNISEEMLTSPFDNDPLVQTASDFSELWGM